MARRKKKRPYRYRSYQTSKWVEGLNLDLQLEPHIVREVIAVLLLGLSVFSLLAILGAAGSVGQVFYNMLRVWRGWTSFILPLLLVGSGIALFYPVKYKFATTNIIGMVLFVVAISSLMHLFVSSGNGVAMALSGAGGGYLGFVVALGLVKSVDFWASLLILGVVFFISLLLVFGQPLRELYYRMRISLPPMPRVSRVVINDTNGGRDEDYAEDEDTPAGGAKKEEEPKLTTTKQPIKKKERESEADFTPQLAPTSDYTPPPLDLLSNVATKVDSGNIRQNVGIIQETLEDFGLEVEMSEVNVGPTVTQYTLKPAAGVKLSRINNLSNDLALALAAHPIRIEAPIPVRR